MQWLGWFVGLRSTLLFVGIVAVTVTVTIDLAGRGFINPLDWEVSPSQWWGIFTAHFFDRDLDHYLGNMRGLFIFAGLFTVASLAMGTFHVRDVREKFDARLPWIILGSAFFVMLLMWLEYIIAGAGSGMGTSAIVSAAFGAGTGLYIVVTQATTRSENGVGSKRLKRRALFFMVTFVALYLPLYGLSGSLPELRVHWMSFSVALFGSLVWHFQSKQDPLSQEMS